MASRLLRAGLALLRHSAAEKIVDARDLLGWAGEWPERARRLSIPDRPHDEADIGGLLFDLAVQPSDWVSRRTEYLTFDDDRAARVRSVIEVDAHLVHDGLIDGRLPQLNGQVLLPIALHELVPHRNVELRGPEGFPLPFLRKSEERELVAAGLTDFSYVFFPHDGRELADVGWWDRYDLYLSLIDDLHAPLPGSWAASGEPRIEMFKERTRDIWGPFVTKRLLVAMLPESLFWARPRGLRRRHERFRLEEEHTVQTQFQTRPWGGSGNFEVPIAMAYSEQVVDDNVAVRSVESNLRPAPANVTWSESNHIQPWDLERRIDDTMITIDAPGHALAASYHLHIQCPPGCYVHHGWLVVTRSREVSDTDPVGPENAGHSAVSISVEAEIVQIEDDDAHWSTAHFQYSERVCKLQSSSEDDEVTDDVEVLEAKAVLVLRPMYRGVLRSGVNLAWLTAFMLLTLAFSAGWTAAGFEPVITMDFVPRDTNSVVSLVALVPSVAFGVLIRHEEHLLTKFVLHGYRLRLGYLAATSFAASMALAVGLDGVPLFVVLAGSGTIAAALAAVLAHSGHRSAKGPPGVPGSA